MSSIKTNFLFPREGDPIKQGQRLAQDLSTNFKGIANFMDQASTGAGLLPVGSVINSMLTLDQFLANGGTGWVKADGGTSVSSTYEKITKNATVPNIAAVAPIVSVFIRIN